MPPDIRHVVYLMQENQSFDRIFGWLDPSKGAELPPAGTSITVPLVGWLREGGLDEEMTVSYGPGAVWRQMHHQPHSPARTMREGFTTQTGEMPDLTPTAWKPRHPRVMAERLIQLADTVDREASTREERSASARLARAIIGQTILHVSRQAVPVYGFLSDHYTVCDNWFSTACSFTIPNRSAFIFDSLTGRPSDWTLFKALSKKRVKWAVYTDRNPGELLAGPLVLTRTLPKPAQSKALSELSNDINGWGSTEQTFTYVESRHVGSHHRRSNDHSLAHLWNGQRVVQRVYNALRARDEIWRHTLFIISYDEHGGWYDHVCPGLAPWGKGRYAAGHALTWEDLYGGRVPALLVSPLVKPGILKGLADNSAITALLHLLFEIELRQDGQSLSRHHLTSPSGTSSTNDPFNAAWGSARDPSQGAADPWTGHDPKNELRDEPEWWRRYLEPVDEQQPLPPQRLLDAFARMHGPDLAESIEEGYRELFPGQPVPLGED
jgi:hypothetical protein